MATTSSAPPSSAPGGSISKNDYRFLQNYVYRESGIVLDEDKHYLLDARLLPVARQQGLTSIEGLCNLLRGVKGEPVRRQVVEAMTTNETLFFREAQQYDALRNHILPRLAKEKASLRRLSFWSAAASTGQEAYSLAILLLEMGLGDWHIQIAGTDLNEAVLERARAGRYMQVEVNRGLPVNLLLKYFTRAGLDWQIRDDVRRMVHWHQLDLRQSMRTRGPHDIVFCRNVLISFDTPTKKQILSEIRGTIFRGGYLFLGGAETLLNIDSQFQRVEVGQAVIYQVS